MKNSRNDRILSQSAIYHILQQHSYQILSKEFDCQFQILKVDLGWWYCCLCANAFWFSSCYHLIPVCHWVGFFCLISLGYGLIRFHNFLLPKSMIVCPWFPSWSQKHCSHTMNVTLAAFVCCRQIWLQNASRHRAWTHCLLLKSTCLSCELRSCLRKGIIRKSGILFPFNYCRGHQLSHLSEQSIAENIFSPLSLQFSTNSIHDSHALDSAFLASNPRAFWIWRFSITAKFVVVSHFEKALMTTSALKWAWLLKILTLSLSEST